jgi:hypothetical protein
VEFEFAAPPSVESCISPINSIGNPAPLDSIFVFLSRVLTAEYGNLSNPTKIFKKTTIIQHILLPHLKLTLLKL